MLYVTWFVYMSAIIGAILIASDGVPRELNLARPYVRRDEDSEPIRGDLDYISGGWRGSRDCSSR